MYMSAYEVTFMKKDIHPDYHNIKLQLTNGDIIETRSTWGKEGDKMILEIDVNTHPAWTGDHKGIDKKGRASRFNSKFKNLNLE